MVHTARREKQQVNDCAALGYMYVRRVCGGISLHVLLCNRAAFSASKAYPGRLELALLAGARWYW